MTSVEFVKQFPVREFPKGEVVLRDGEVAEALLAIRSGYVKVTSVDGVGNTTLLWIAGRYDLVPTEYLFLHHRPLDFFYTALTDCTVYQIDKAAFLAYAKTDLSLMTDVAVAMSAHYDDLLARINSIEQANVPDKLLSTLCYLGRRFSADDNVDLHRLGLTLTHHDLADMIGSTRETVTLELRKLRKSGCIDYDLTKFIIDIPACKMRLVR